MITIASITTTLRAAPLRTLAFAFLLLGAAGVRPADAQDYRSSVGWNAGAIWVSALNAGAELPGGEGGGGPARKTEPGVGWTTGLQVDHWLWNGVLGLRAGGGYARHLFEWSNGKREIGTWTGEAGVLARIFVPEAENVFIPYVALGVAGVHYGFGKGPATTFPEAAAYHPGKRSIALAGSAGLGLDIISPWGWDESPIILRLEAADQVAPRSPFRSIESAKRFQYVHNARLTIGLHAGLGSLGGRREPARVPRPPLVVER
jgi:hypothetical protein